jgi:4-hydroxybutyryl-CoA dehydratase/vinylacetyl-CoA-Delta-isomerase
VLRQIRSVLSVVKRQPDGIVVCGAKAHQTGMINSHEIIVLFTITMTEAVKEYAVAFAVPNDAKVILSGSLR